MFGSFGNALSMFQAPSMYQQPQVPQGGRQAERMARMPQPQQAFPGFPQFQAPQRGNALMGMMQFMNPNMWMQAQPQRERVDPRHAAARDERERRMNPQQQNNNGGLPSGVKQIGNGPAFGVPSRDGSYTPLMPFWGSF